MKGGKESSGSSEVRFIKDNYFYSYEVEVNTLFDWTDQNLEEDDFLGTYYLHEKAGKYYQAQDDGTSQLYSELSQSEFAALLARKKACYIDDITAAADNEYRQIDKALSALTGSPAATTSYQGVQNAAYSFASSGESHLSLTYAHDIV